MKDKDFRKVVHTWFQLQNQCWLDGNFQPCYGHITPDCEPEIQKEYERWRLIKNMQKERQMTPLKRETRILSVDEKVTGEHVEVHALISVRNIYSIQNQWLEEESEEWAYFRLDRTRDGWKIAALTVDEMPRAGGKNQVITVNENVDASMDTHSVSAGYDRMRAVQYAETYWNAPNPNYLYFSEDDCTNFVSQCLHAGGIPMRFSTRRDQGWWYRRIAGKQATWSYSWTVAHRFFHYLKGKRSSGLSAVQVETPEQLQLGDIICYDWEGDGRWNHNTIVTSFDPGGAPLVNAHTINSRHRYWEYKDSPAWTPQTKYAFFHIL